MELKPPVSGQRETGAQKPGRQKRKVTTGGTGTGDRWFSGTRDGGMEERSGTHLCRSSNRITETNQHIVIYSATQIRRSSDSGHTHRYRG